MGKAIQSTGLGVGGSGGIPEDRVRHVSLANVGHVSILLCCTNLTSSDSHQAFPFVTPGVVADHIALWLSTEMQRFREEEEEWHQKCIRRDPRDSLRLNAQWMAAIKPPPEVRTQPAKESDKSKL